MKHHEMTEEDEEPETKISENKTIFRGQEKNEGFEQQNNDYVNK